MTLPPPPTLRLAFTRRTRAAGEELSDAALVAALHDGQGDAWLIFFDRYGSLVERLVARLLGPDAEIPDVVQNVFLSALESVHTLADPTLLAPWLTRLTVFKVRSLIRRRRRWRFLRFSAPEEIPEVPAPAVTHDARQALQRSYQILAGMPTDLRIVFVLRFIDGMAVNAVSDILSVSDSTTKRLLKRAERMFESRARGTAGLEEWVPDQRLGKQEGGDEPRRK